MIRCFAATVLVVCAPWVFAAFPGPENPAAAAEWFAQVLRDGDARELEQAIEPGVSFGEWQEPRELLSRYECISAEVLDSATESPAQGTTLVRMHLRAAGLTRAEWRPRAGLPERWRLDLRRQPDGAWRLRSVMTEERFVARCMMAERAPEDAERHFFAASADPLRLLSSYTNEAIGNKRFAAFMEHALVLARESGSAAHESEVLQFYGVLSAIVGNGAAGMERAQRALEVARSTNDPDLIASALMRVGTTLIAHDRREEALAPLSESGALAERTNDPVTSLRAQYMHGYILDQLDRHFACLRSVERLLLLSRRYGWGEGERIAAFTKGNVLYELGKLDATLATYGEAAALARAQGSPDHASRAYHNMARVLVQQRRLDLAIATQQQAAAAVPAGSHDRAVMHTELAIYQAMSGRLREAEQSLDVTLGMLQNPDGAFFTAKSIFLNRSGRPDEALSNARAAFEWLERHDYGGEYKVSALTEAGRALRALGRREEAIQTFRSAIDLAEAERRHAAGLAASKITLFERKLAPYVQLVEVLAEREDTLMDALRAAEQFKARSLMDVSAGNEADLSAELTAEEREREKTLETRVIEGNRAMFRSGGSREQRDEQLASLNAARVDLEGFRSEMRLRHPRLAQRDVEVPAQLALPDADAVELVVAEERVLAFVVPARDSGRSVRRIDIPIARPELAARIERYLRALSNRSFGYRAEARALYDTLIAPLAPHLPGDGPLCIVPDGPLWSLPFHTLIAPDGRHLAERRSVTIAPSLAILHTGRPRRDGDVTLLAFGNPRVGGPAHETVRAAAYDIPMSALPEAEAEVRTIAALYGGGAIHVGGEATESAFKRKSSKYRILHLAMHGFVASGAPLYSGLVFSSDPENDGILEAREVAEMKLDADLAVLSACDTAAGEISDGEGVVGLSWAFLAAGCPTTVVSHWKADSAATARLMVEFHRHVRQGNPPAEALRRAQLALMRSDAYRHPYYWAPFIVVGRNAAIGD